MISKEQALQKLRQYCAYQERCHSEVEQKLWALRIRPSDHAEIISTLIEENYLDEERFARQYAGGKFRMNEWGRKKIIYALREKRVSEYSIKKGLQEINQDDYEKTLEELALKKFELLGKEQPMVRKKKTMDYLLQKGFESELITKVLSYLINRKD